MSAWRPMFYRVQDASGRGPWRPGFSVRWIEDEAPVGHLDETIMDLMPIRQLRALPTDKHYGCACRSMDALMEWFTPVERARLRALGFHPVSLTADVVLAESHKQSFIGRVRPFSEGVSRRSWPDPPSRGSAA